MAMAQITVRRRNTPAFRMRPPRLLVIERCLTWQMSRAPQHVIAGALRRVGSICVLDSQAGSWALRARHHAGHGRPNEFDELVQRLFGQTLDVGMPGVLREVFARHGGTDA